MYVGTGSILVLCTEHQLKYDRQTYNKAVRVFTFYHLMFINTYITFKYTMQYLNTVFKYTSN